jgi:hypothetical protein
MVRNVAASGDTEDVVEFLKSSLSIAVSFGLYIAILTWFPG